MHEPHHHDKVADLGGGLGYHFYKKKNSVRVEVANNQLSLVHGNVQTKGDLTVRACMKLECSVCT